MKAYNEYRRSSFVGSSQFDISEPQTIKSKPDLDFKPKNDYLLEKLMNRNKNRASIQRIYADNNPNKRNDVQLTPKTSKWQKSKKMFKFKDLDASKSHR